MFYSRTKLLLRIKLHKIFTEQQQYFEQPDDAKFHNRFQSPFDAIKS